VEETGGTTRIPGDKLNSEREMKGNRFLSLPLIFLSIRRLLQASFKDIEL
jgi:hypothetical protein